MQTYKLTVVLNGCETQVSHPKGEQKLGVCENRVLSRITEHKKKKKKKKKKDGEKCIMRNLKIIILHQMLLQ
jgi:hypothetical protein